MARPASLACSRPAGRSTYRGACRSACQGWLVVDRGHRLDGPGRLLAQLGGLQNLDVSAEAEEVGERQVGRFDRHARAHPAARIGHAGGFDRGHGRGTEQTTHAPDTVIGQPDHRVHGMQLAVEVGQVAVPVAGEVESGFGAEAAVAGSGRDDLVDPVRAHSPVAPGYDVPGAGLEYQTMRLQPPGYLGWLLPSLIGDLDDLALPDRARNGRKMGHVLGAAIPAGGVQVEALG